LAWDAGLSSSTGENSFRGLVTGFAERAEVAQWPGNPGRAARQKIMENLRGTPSKTRWSDRMAALGVADRASKADNRVFNPQKRLRKTRFGPNPDMRLDEYSRYGIL
jgi:hypothetical protein